VLLGHSRIDTTARYTAVTPGVISTIASPFDPVSESLQQPLSFPKAAFVKTLRPRRKKQPLRPPVKLGL
jgi:hypothetical protein